MRRWGGGLRNGSGGRGECSEFFSETLDLAHQPECLGKCVDHLLCRGLNAGCHVFL